MSSTYKLSNDRVCFWIESTSTEMDLSDLISDEIPKWSGYYSLNTKSFITYGIRTCSLACCRVSREPRVSVKFWAKRGSRAASRSSRDFDRALAFDINCLFDNDIVRVRGTVVVVEAKVCNRLSQRDTLSHAPE